MELYALVFEQAGALHMLERFASHNGADFYGRPRNGGTLTLNRTQWQVPETLPFGPERLVPVMAGQILDWRASHRTF
jgi:dihydroorotase